MITVSEQVAPLIDAGWAAYYEHGCCDVSLVEGENKRMCNECLAYGDDEGGEPEHEDGCSMGALRAALEPFTGVPR